VISFVVTAREEDPAVLRRTLTELRATAPPREREILVVDDGSSRPIAGVPGDVTIIRHETPLGVSRARRRGCALAVGEVLVCLDAHMTFAHDWLDRMLAHVDSGALLCAPFRDYERSTCYCFGADFEWCGQRDYRGQRSPGFRFRHRVTSPGTGAPDVPMAIGACYMLRRSTYEALGGFSPLFGIWGGSEQDVSARAWLAGFGVKCVTDAGVGHLSRPAFPYTVRFDDVEFNQLMSIRTVFEAQTSTLLESFFDPLPDGVARRLNGSQDEVAAWRAVVQTSRRSSDLEFFSRFVPELYRLRAAG